MSQAKVSTASPLTHFDAQGQAHMVDVGAKAHTRRVAVAQGRITMLPATLALIASGSAKKGGDVVDGFEPLMVPPLGSAKLGGSAAALGATPVLVYVNDYGGQPVLTFRCNGTNCSVDETKRSQ